MSISDIEFTKSMMRHLFSIVLVGLLTLSGLFWAPTSAVVIAADHATTIPVVFAPQQVATLPGLQGVFAGDPPDTLGTREGQLAPCPNSPNCVVSQTTDIDHRIDPIAYHTSREQARETLLKVLTVVPNTTITEQTERYIRVESSSNLMGFVDDGEFYFPPDESVIHVRFAARLGESDLGVNRRRVEQIRLAMQDLDA